MLKSNTLNEFGTIFVNSSLFLEIEEETYIISGPVIDIYDVAFIKCNTKSRAYSVAPTNKLFSTIAFFEHSGGICYGGTTSIFRIQSFVSFDIKSSYCISAAFANVEMSQVNFTNNKCNFVYAMFNYPSYHSSRLVSIIENECSICSKLEAEFQKTNINSHFQYVRNKCSQYLIQAWRAVCNCDWFYFIDNSISTCQHADNGVIKFANSFSTSQIRLAAGSMNGAVGVNLLLTELPFPTVLRKPQTGRLKRVNFPLSIAMSLAAL